MGIKNLNTLLKKHVKNGIITKNLDSFTNNIIAIDTSNYLYRFKYDNGNYLKKFVDQITTFWKYRMTPIYIFDGSPPSEKNETLKKRQAVKNKSKNNIFILEEEIKLQDKLYDKKQNNLSINKLFSNQNDNSEQLQLQNDIFELKQSIQNNKNKLKKKIKNVISISPSDITNCKNLFNLLGIKYIVADSEADILCCELLKNKIVDCCLSEDMDFLTHGCSKLLKNYNYRDNTVKVYILPIILKELDLSYDKFVDVCILCGSDYTSNIRGIGPISALKYIKKYDSIENIIEELINKNSKFSIDNFNFQIARDIFKTKKKSPLDREDVLVGHVDSSKLYSFFLENKIKNSVQKILFFRNKLYQ